MWRTIVSTATLLAALAAIPGVHAGNRAAVLRQAESSVLVTGTITIAPDGSVQAHTLAPAAPLGDAVVRLVASNVAQWRFQPVQVEGRAVTAKVPMHVRLVARKTDDGKFSIAIASTHFGANGGVPTDQVQPVSMRPPSFPQESQRMGGKGTVYLILQVGRDGRVANVDAEQVNLRVAGNEQQMKVLRNAFAHAAIRRARDWTFAIPTTGKQAGEDGWLVRVPVDFVLTGPGESQPASGEWDAYIPGPRNLDIPWAHERLRTASSPDAVPEGGVHPLQQGAQLLTPPSRT